MPAIGTGDIIAFTAVPSVTASLIAFPKTAADSGREELRLWRRRLLIAVHEVDVRDLAAVGECSGYPRDLKRAHAAYAPGPGEL